MTWQFLKVFPCQRFHNISVVISSSDYRILKNIDNFMNEFNSYSPIEGFATLKLVVGKFELREFWKNIINQILI